MAEDMLTAAAIEPPVEVADERRGRPLGPPFAPEPPDGLEDGDHHGDGEPHWGPHLSNARLGLLIFLGAETMLFAGLLSTFVLFRFATPVWPPATLPRLPVGVTGINTLILLYSAYTMWRANRAVRAGEQQGLVSMLLLTAVLGVIFLVVQGYEWVQLIRVGLYISSGMYGATFYTLIGCHGLHVCGAVIWLLSVLWRATRGRYTASHSAGVALCGMYWYYVVGLWPILYGLVYLY
jgi:cytochrome c oxidase subunit 3